MKITCENVSIKRQPLLSLYVCLNFMHQGLHQAPDVGFSTMWFCFSKLRVNM